MSYPKDSYYEKPPVGGNTQYPQMVQAPPGQYFTPAYPGAPPPYSAVQSAGPGLAMPTYQPATYAYTTGVSAQPQHYPSSNMMSAAPPPYISYGQPVWLKDQPKTFMLPEYTSSWSDGRHVLQWQYNPGYPVQQGFAYSAPPIAAAQFDAGARFDGIASQNIPPPPPGYAPNAAQMAAAQGGTVIATQKKSNWFAGNGGGVSFW